MRYDGIVSLLRLHAILLLLVGATGCGASRVDSLAPSTAPQPGTYAADPTRSPYEEGIASYYSDRLAGHATAAGEPYDPTALTAAHRSLPFGSVVEVARPDGRRVTVRINDRGPHDRKRILDLSRRAAMAIGLLGDGTADVAIRLVFVPEARQARARSATHGREHDAR